MRAGGLWPATSLVALAQHHPCHVPLHNGRRHGRVSSSPRGPRSRQSVATACLRLPPGRATGGGARGGPAPGQGPLLRAPCRSAEPSGTAGTVHACHPRHAGRRLPTEPPTALALLEVPRRPAHCPARPHERPWPAAALLPRPARHRTDPALPAARPAPWPPVHAAPSGARGQVRRAPACSPGAAVQLGSARAQSRGARGLGAHSAAKPRPQQTLARTVTKSFSVFSSAPARDLWAASSTLRR